MNAFPVRLSPIERDAPSDVRLFMQAFRELTGYEVFLTYERSRAIGVILSMGLWTRDLAGVVDVIRRDMRSPRPRFNDASLQFENLVGKPETFESRAHAWRQWVARRRGGAPKAPVPTRGVDGTMRLLPPEPVPPKQVTEAMAQELFRMARQMKGAEQ